MLVICGTATVCGCSALAARSTGERVDVRAMAPSPERSGDATPTSESPSMTREQRRVQALQARQSGAYKGAGEVTPPAAETTARN